MSDNQETTESFSKDDLAVLDSTPDTGTTSPDTTDAGKTESDTGGRTETTTTPESKTATEFKFSDNWRDQWLTRLPEDQRGKAKDWLGKRATPEDVLRAGLNADAKISEAMRDRVKIPTGKNDDPKEVSAFRKALGIPEKPEAYTIVYGDGVDPATIDKDLEASIRAGALEVGATQKQMEYFSKMHWAIKQHETAAQEAQRVARQQANMDEIRAYAGADYRSNVELTNRMFQEDMKALGYSSEDTQALLGMQLADGSHLGDDPRFVKWAFKVARERADDGAFISGEGTEGVDVDKRIDDIIAKRETEPKEYERLQPELKRLVAVANRRKAR